MAVRHSSAEIAQGRAAHVLVHGRHVGAASVRRIAGLFATERHAEIADQRVDQRALVRRVGDKVARLARRLAREERFRLGVGHQFREHADNNGAHQLRLVRQRRRRAHESLFRKMLG